MKQEENEFRSQNRTSMSLLPETMSMVRILSKVLEKLLLGLDQCIKIQA